MKLNKYSVKSDGIADLYRSALYLAKGADEIGLDFLRKAREKLGEKILDQYKKLKPFPS